MLSLTKYQVIIIIFIRVHEPTIRMPTKSKSSLLKNSHQYSNEFVKLFEIIIIIKIIKYRMVKNKQSNELLLIFVCLPARKNM